MAVLLDPTNSFRFDTPLPIPGTVDGTKNGIIVMRAEQSEQWLGLYDAQGDPLTTTVWGYGEAGGPIGVLGPTIVAESGTPTRVMWQNKLPKGDYPLPFDKTLHGVDVELVESGLKPTVVHLHGGHSSDLYDGGPLQWYAQIGAPFTGPAFAGTVYTYENDQAAAPLWYHDHAIGMTRTNVYMGLAGAYVVRDEYLDALQEPGPDGVSVLPRGSFDLPLVIQDRAFTADGQLYMPGRAGDPLPGLFHEDGTPVLVGEEFPGIPADADSVVPEFLGDHILVNGAAWPTLSVERADYMFTLLNGSDSRFYVLQFSDADVRVHLVGGDGGLLPEAITVMDGDGVQEDGEQLVLAPGERLQVVVEFDGVAADTDALRLLNVGPLFDPFKGFDDDGALAEVDAATMDDPVGNIMEFTLRDGESLHQASVSGGTPLNTAYAPIDTTGAAVRKVGLYEGTDHMDRVTPLLGVAEDEDFAMYHFADPATEVVALGATERWQIHNFTEDAHPIHLHLVQFQVLGRTALEFAMDEETGLPLDVGDPGLRYGEDVVYGESRPLFPEDLGWQDTVWVAPGEMLEIAATFDRAGDYVWHCHILSHEDHDMMRPLIVEDMDIA